MNEKIHDTVKDLKTDISQEAEHLIMDGLTTIGRRMKTHEDTVTETTKELERKIAQNTRLLKDTHTNTTNYTNTQPPSTPVYFYGDNRMHPRVFLTRLKQHLETLHSNIKIKQVIQSLIKGQAEFWYELVEDKFETVEEFEHLIIKQYWSEHTQQKIRFNLFNGKYKEEMGISRENYIMRKIYNIKYLEPEFQEVEMVRYLARHFETEIHNVIITQRIVTLESLIEYLRGIDDYKIGWRRPVHRDNRQVNDRQNRNNDNSQNENNFDYGNRERKFDYNNRNFNNVGREYNNRNINGQQRYDHFYQNRNNENTTNQRDRKTPDTRRENRTYAQITNTNIERKDNGDTHTQRDINKIQTQAQMHTRLENSDFQ